MVYVYQPTDTMGAFAQGFQFTDALRQRQAAQQKAEMEAQQKQQRQASLQQAIQGIRANPTPQAFADFYLQFPEMDEQMKSYRSTLADGDKATLTGAAREAIVAQRTGQSPAPVYRRYAEAAKNSNRPDLAKQFEDAAALAEASPEGADLTAKMFYQSIDPDGFKEVFGQTERIQNFEYFKEVAGEKTALEIAGVTPKDGIQVLPNGMVIAGPDSPLARSMGGGGAAPELPTVNTKEDLDALAPGAEFFGPDGKRRVKSGGAASNGSGNFRAGS